MEEREGCSQGFNFFSFSLKRMQRCLKVRGGGKTRMLKSNIHDKWEILRRQKNSLIYR